MGVPRADGCSNVLMQGPLAPNTLLESATVLFNNTLMSSGECPSASAHRPPLRPCPYTGRAQPRKARHSTHYSARHLHRINPEPTQAQRAQRNDGSSGSDPCSAYFTSSLCHGALPRRDYSRGHRWQPSAPRQVRGGLQGSPGRLSKRRLQSQVIPRRAARTRQTPWLQEVHRWQHHRLQRRLRE